MAINLMRKITRVRGVEHIYDPFNEACALVVDLKDPSRSLRFETVLSSRDGLECSSVNHSDKDPHHANCAPPYPFEYVDDMLRRYVGQGAIVAINTDYFGPDGDHGAQGLAVKNGLRLDGEAHGVFNDLAYTTPCLAISPSNSVVICVPHSKDNLLNNLTSIYYNTAGGWPLMIQGGKIIEEPCRYPPYGPISICNDSGRSAAGLTVDGQLVLITARQTVARLAAYMVDRFGVHTALSFDGGRSASMSWLDEEGDIQHFYPLTETRAVAAGLLVFAR